MKSCVDGVGLKPEKTLIVSPKGTLGTNKEDLFLTSFNVAASVA